MKLVLKITGIAVLSIVILAFGLLLYLSTRPAVPNNYTKTVKTVSEIEAKYLAMGNSDIKYMQESADEPIKKYEIYYPAELETSGKTYPAVVFVNGSGIPGSKYKALFRHLASWGFIVVGNEDPNAGNGTSTERTLLRLLELNEDAGSVLCGRVDTENIGISGHSQGGAGVLNAITASEHSALWKTAVALSPTQEELALALGWIYDMKKVDIPLLMLAGTEGDFETQVVIPFEAMQTMYGKVSAPKVMARRTGAEHGQMLYFADGYVTAWFLWQLQSDTEAAKAFVGENADLLYNGLYQDQQSSIG